MEPNEMSLRSSVKLKGTTLMPAHDIVALTCDAQTSLRSFLK